MLQHLWDFFNKKQEELPILLQAPTEPLNLPEPPVPVGETPKPPKTPRPRKPKEEIVLTIKEEPQELILPDIIKSEVNFLVFPFFALDKGKIKRTEVEYKDSIERDGKKLDILWNVSSNPKYGYPGPFDREVHRAVEQIITETLQEKRIVENPIPLGSLRHICKRMDVAEKGGNLKEIKQAFEKIVATTIKSEGTFYDKRKKQWLSETYHLYIRFIEKGKELEDGRIADTNYLFLDPFYIQSLNSFYIKPLDLKYLKILKTNIASRLYEIVGVRFYGLKDSPYAKYDYHELCQLLPLEPQNELWKAKSVFKKPHQELITTGFFEKVEWPPRKTKTEWFIKYFPGPRAIEEIQQYQKQTKATLEQLPPVFEEKPTIRTIQGPLLSDPQQKILNQLIDFGITEKVARELVKSLEPKYIQEWLGVIPYVPNIDNKQAYLVKALKEKWIIPDNLKQAKKSATQKQLKENCALCEATGFIEIQDKDHRAMMPCPHNEARLKKHGFTYNPNFNRWIKSQEA